MGVSNNPMIGIEPIKDSGPKALLHLRQVCNEDDLAMQPMREPVKLWRV